MERHSRTSSAGARTSARCYGSDDVPSYAAAARAIDLAGLPPTCVVVGAIDGFRDEDIGYAQRLNQAGVPCELHVIAGLPHAYQLVPGSAAVQLAVHCMDDWLARQLAAAARRDLSVPRPRRSERAGASRTRARIMASWTKEAASCPSRTEDVALPVAAAVPGVRAPLLQQVPLGRRAALVVGEGVAEHAGREGHVRLGLADAGVGTHGGADQEAVGRVGDECLIGGGIVGCAGEAHPGVELGRADQLGIADVDVVDDDDLPRALAPYRAAGLLGRGHGARRVGVPDHVGLVGAEQHERAGAPACRPG